MDRRSDQRDPVRLVSDAVARGEISRAKADDLLRRLAYAEGDALAKRHNRRDLLRIAGALLLCFAVLAVAVGLADAVDAWLAGGIP